MDKSLLNRLEATCGASCYHTPDKCHCFGVMSDETLDDLGLDRDDCLPDHAFYEKEHCPHYDAENYYVKKNHDEIKMFVRKYLGDRFSEEEIENHISTAISINTEGGDWTAGLMMAKVLKGVPKVDQADDKSGFVYLIHTIHGVKIGRTKRLKYRFNELGVKMPFDIIHAEYYEVSDYISEETNMHRKYSDLRINGEWFNLSRKDIVDIRNYFNQERYGNDVQRKED